MARWILAFVAALGTAYVVAAVLASQHVLGALAAMGMPVDLALGLEVTLHDLVGMLPTLAPLLAVALLAALPVILLICRGRPGWRLLGFVSGFFCAVVVMHLALTAVLDVTPVAAARGTGGLLLQGLAGALAGYVFYRLAGTASTPSGNHRGG
jgi:hypothetical protein